MGKSAEKQFSSRQPGGEVAVQGGELQVPGILVSKGFDRWPSCGVGCLRVPQVGGNNRTAVLGGKWSQGGTELSPWQKTNGNCWWLGCEQTVTGSKRVLVSALRASWEDSSSSQAASPCKASEADYAPNSIWLLHKASKADVKAQEHRFFLQGVNLPSYCFIFSFARKVF